MTLTTTNQLRVASPVSTQGRRLVTMQSEGTLTVAGSATQGAGTITLRGTGMSSTIYSFDTAAGVLRSTVTNSRTQIEFDLGYRTDRLIQRTTRTATRL
jgi:hypothetical protein